MQSGLLPVSRLESSGGSDERLPAQEGIEIRSQSKLSTGENSILPIGNLAASASAPSAVCCGATEKL